MWCKQWGIGSGGRLVGCDTVADQACSSCTTNVITWINRDQLLVVPARVKRLPLEWRAHVYSWSQAGRCTPVSAWLICGLALSTGTWGEYLVHVDFRETWISRVVENKAIGNWYEIACILLLHASGQLWTCVQSCMPHPQHHRSDHLLISSIYNSIVNVHWVNACASIYLLL